MLTGRLIHGWKSTAVTGLIAQRPHQHTRILTIAYHHPHHTVDTCRRPFRQVARKHTFIIAQPVRFDIGLIHHHHSHAVAKFIPAGIVRIMRGTYKINVPLFHQFQVFFHFPERQSPSLSRRKFMAVDSAYFEFLSIQQQMVSFSHDLSEGYR